MKKIFFSASVLLLGNLCFSQWSQVNNGIQDLSFGVLTISGHNGKMYTGTLGGYKLYTSDDYGNNWSEIAPPVAFGLPVSTFSYGNRLFFGLNVVSNDVYYTEDDGATWQVAVGGPQSSVVDGFYALSGKLYCYTTNSGVYRSSDGGTNWIQINNGLTVLNVEKLESIGNRLLACTINGGVYVSDDYGDTWVQSNAGISTSHLAGYQLFRLGTDLYYMDQSSGRYQSTDQGNSWTTITTPAFWGIKPKLVYRNSVSGNIYMKNAFGVFGEIDSLFVSSNEGANWTNITGDLPQALNEAEITEYNGYVFYAFDISVPGEGVYRKGDFNALSELKNFDVKAFPNPANDVLNLESTDPMISLRIMDHSGRVLFCDKLDNVKEHTIQLGELSTGCYYLEIITNSGYTSLSKVIAE